MSVAFRGLSDAAAWYEQWLVQAALPLWSQAGVRAGDGAFLDALTPDGQALPSARRGLAQARQVWSFATAARAEVPGPWLQIARRGWAAYVGTHRRPDGLFARMAATGGPPRDEARLYDQAFALLAMAALREMGEDTEEIAGALLIGLEAMRHPAGGYREVGAEPFQANATMHLLEAALAWDASGPSWRALADELAGLALGRFIDADRGFLWEVFDAGWTPLSEEDGGRVEPGHQFEWAFLLNDWAARRGRSPDPARALFDAGGRGVDKDRSVAVGTLGEDLSVRDPVARLWAQCEYLRASLAFGERAQAVAAANGLAGFLTTPAQGVWWDRRRADGGFEEEPARATSLYHLIGAILALLQSVRSGKSGA